MAEAAKQISFEEREVNRILAETRFAVTKTEADIKKLSALGTHELQLNPPGMPATNPQQLKKDIENLKDNIQHYKADALKQIDKVIENLPETEKNNYKAAATKELFPEKAIKENEKADLSFGTRFTQSLGFSKFLQKENDAIEKSTRNNPEPVKAPGKERD